MMRSDKWRWKKNRRGAVNNDEEKKEKQAEEMSLNMSSVSGNRERRIKLNSF